MPLPLWVLCLLPPLSLVPVLPPPSCCYHCRRGFRACCRRCCWCRYWCCPRFVLLPLALRVPRLLPLLSLGPVLVPLAGVSPVVVQLPLPLRVYLLLPLSLVLRAA
jgi:hypothetical protein